VSVPGEVNDPHGWKLENLSWTQ